jgi:hypothetical protein
VGPSGSVTFEDFSFTRFVGLPFSLEDLLIFKFSCLFEMH